MTHKPSKTFTYTVTARDIKRFAQAIGDNNPLYHDEEFAKRSPFGAIVAPPLFCQSMTFEDVPLAELPEDLSPSELDVDVPAQRTVGGSSHYEFYQFIRPGDEITVSSCIDSVTPKEGKSGPLYLVQVETRFTNQFGERVAKEVATYVKK
ncbi:MaoC family dehydratase N-terminal domain-containing protein [Marinobacter pelagius]|uniref:FAS1-like dehydratase domain-containing protein n=1 Tax=Marinobacter sp. C7 TaxID=2951363 RepID=UPI001EF13627|nr:MaoC family dehydratase N-terminal domain-containing protein [Marinobacter sp. C7]MCG7199482.1 MaoC family dehydratase N-terminal domain-containing protein [Marinobacter sp. C7]